MSVPNWDSKVAHFYTIMSNGSTAEELCKGHGLIPSDVRHVVRQWCFKHGFEVPAEAEYRRGPKVRREA